jgi:murein DD-endopeptidase MepM/ murein hydrolase activator NlpD
VFGVSVFGVFGPVGEKLSSIISQAGRRLPQGTLPAAAGAAFLGGVIGLAMLALPSTAALPQPEATVIVPLSPAETAPAAIAAAPAIPLESRAPELLAATMGPPLPREPRYRTRTVQVRPGDTLMHLLVSAGVPRQDAYNAIQALSSHFDPRRIRAGQELTLTFVTSPGPVRRYGEDDEIRVTAASFTPGAARPTRDEEAEARLASLAIKTAVDRYLEIRRADEDRFVGEEVIEELEQQHYLARGVIDSSLYLAAVQAGVPDGVIVELIRMFSYDIDFQREIRKGDSFEIFYTVEKNADGEVVRIGNIEMGQISNMGKTRRLYRFEGHDKVVDYFDIKGQSARRFLLRTPVDGARISSNFGMRRHPIQGYNRMHRGVDFAAPTGTPIMAAGNGVVERASRFGSFGHFVRIRHANGYHTIYAHLSRYGAGIRAGVRVRQGQIIGYVGATGAATGPHLHYEVHLNGEALNPMSIRLPTGRTLEGKELEDFRKQMGDIETRIAQAPVLENVATASARDADDPGLTP